MGYFMPITRIPEIGELSKRTQLFRLTMFTFENIRPILKNLHDLRFKVYQETKIPKVLALVCCEGIRQKLGMVKACFCLFMPTASHRISEQASR